MKEETNSGFYTENSPFYKLFQEKSAVYILDELLESDRCLTQQEIAEKTNISQVSVRKQLDVFTRIDLVTELSENYDQPRYTVSSDSDLGKTLDQLRETL